MDCYKNNSITVYRGFDTRFMGVDFLQIKFESQFDLENYSAKFILGPHTETWDTLVDGVIINLTKEETAQLPLGIVYGTLIVFDNEGKSKPFSTAIPFMCTEWVEGKHEKVDQFNMSVDAKFEGETVMTITIETAQVSEQMVDDKIAAHNESEEAHPYIQGLIEEEAETREQADNQLQTNIDNEATIRANADNTLQSNIDSEAQTRATDDASLGQSIAQETQDRISDVASLDADIQTKQPKLTSANAGNDIEITEVGGIVKINSTAEGVTVHNQLTGRDESDAHPIESITGLGDELLELGASLSYEQSNLSLLNKEGQVLSTVKVESGGISNLDGGSSTSVYLISQKLDCGDSTEGE